MVLGLMAPEIFVAALGMVLLLWAAWRGEKDMRAISFAASAGMIAALGLAGQQTQDGFLFQEMFVSDAFRRFVKMLVLGLGALSVLLVPSFMAKTSTAKAEQPVLMIFAILGMMLMASANSLISFYVGLELQNLSLYVLVAMRRDDPRSSEAGLKYFTLGALSSAFLIFGFSLIYGFTGSTSYDEIQKVLAAPSALSAGLAMGIGLSLAGLAFKISCAPFHMWTPDVYEGAPTPVTAFLAAVPKLAAFALLAGFLATPMLPAQQVWTPVLVALSVLSMLWGSLGGLRQSNLKRLMAYSAIANMGTILIGFVAFGSQGVQGALIYLALYGVATLGFLGGLTLLEHQGKAVETVDDVAGLFKTHPVLALGLAAFLFSLAGIPPLAGFLGKYFVLLAAVQAGWTELAVLGVIASVLAAGYYLRVVKVMFFDERKGLPLALISEKTPTIVVLIAAILVTVLIMMPSPLVEGARQAAESLVVR